ncbi:MAG: hypothetical protein J5640_04145 [Bacteroidales bacterium]|nr:hypothetical protein [Bacteroidales bacterium]
MKRFTTILSALLLSAAALAESPVKVSGTAIIQSAYLWRGEKVCEVNFNPVLEASVGGFTAQAFAYLPFNGTYKEIDLDLFYTLGPWQFHVADYFIRFANSPVKENYFDFSKQTTGHLFEGIICYSPEAVPVNAKWFTFFFGDWMPEPDGSRGKPTFSSYLELEAYHDFDAWGRGSFVLGSSILKGPYTAHTKDFAVIHCELRYTKTLELGAVKVPLSVSYLVNPYARTTFMNAGVGVSF